MMTDLMHDETIVGGEAATKLRDKEIHVNTNTIAKAINQNVKAINQKKTVRTIRRTVPTMRGANGVREARATPCDLFLSRAEAAHLLVLCASSPMGVSPVEETLFAKLGDYVRQS